MNYEKRIYSQKKISYIHCYRKKPNVITGIIKNKLNCIDMGIALCHIYEESDTFSYKKLDTASEKKGYIYMGTVI